MTGAPARTRWRRLLSTPSGWALLGGLAVVIIYCASMAAAGPWDPWETHYGEVARQINVRHDPLDLWWQAGNGGPDGATEKSFASKPALPFWLMALSMRILGVGTNPDPAEMVQPLWPELAIRLPSLLAGLSAAAFLGYVLWRLWSPRAGVVAALVLSTMPQWAIVTRQALTDMFFVGPVVLAIGAWALAWLQPERALRTRGQGRREIPWDRAYLGFFVVFLLGAIVPLAVVHQHAFDPHTWAMYGRSARRSAGLVDIQVEMFVYWALAVVVLLRSLRWRRRSQCWMGILYVAAGLSLMGKGLIGPGLIGAFVLLDLLVSGRWDRLRHAGLPTGIAIFAITGFPWHHAMILFRGQVWVQELIIENNLRRFASGEQKQAVGSFAFYLETLGLAALPWAALLPVAFIGSLRASIPGLRTSSEASSDASTRDAQVLADPNAECRREVHRAMLLWLAISLWAIGYSVTKYYHYLLPCLPPAAALVGLWIDERVGRRGRRHWPAMLVGSAILVGVVRDAIHTPAWIAHLTTYLYTGMWVDGAPEVDRLVVTTAPFAIGMVLWALRWRRQAALTWVFSGLLTTAYVIDDYLPAASENWSQRTAMRKYFAERGPDDRIVSWWFYYRGETFFTKGDVWVMKDQNRSALLELFEEYEGKDASLWFITTTPHAKRLSAHVPSAYRDRIELVYASFHYTMYRIRM